MFSFTGVGGCESGICEGLLGTSTSIAASPLVSGVFGLGESVSLVEQNYERTEWDSKGRI